MQRATAALLLQPHDPDVVEVGRELCGDAWGVVDAGVVGDGDPHRVREAIAQMAVQPMDRIGERGLLVVHGHDDVEDGYPECACDERSVGPGFEAKGGRIGQVGHDIHRRARRCAGRWRKLCTSYELFGAAVRSYTSTSSTLIGA